MDTPSTQIHDRPLFCLGTGASMKKGGRDKLVVWIETSLKRYSKCTMINYFESNCENAYLSVSIITRKKPFINQVNLYALTSFKQMLRNDLKKQIKVADKISFD